MPRSHATSAPWRTRPAGARAPLLALALVTLLAAGCDRGGNGQSAVQAIARDTIELRAMVDTMLPALARLAALEPRAGIRLGRRDSAEVRAYIERQLDEELPPDLLAALHSTYALLGLVPDSLDLRSLMLRLYAEQILGYYDPQERTFYVVEGVAPASIGTVLAHELVHALQDQYANLDSLTAGERGSDRQMAAHAALEGHATIVMFAWLAEQAEGRRLDPVSLPNPAGALRAGLEQQHEQFPVFREAPPIIRETLLFPYVAGADFVYRLWQVEPRDRPAPLGRWLPQSTEQVIHPRERFLLRRDEPTPIALAPQQGHWRALGRDNALGELETAIFLSQHLEPSARNAARGWDGDIYRLLQHPNGDQALFWASVWDDQVSAERFVQALERIGRKPDTPRMDVLTGSLDGRPTVRVVVYRETRPAAAELPSLCLGDRSAGCGAAGPGRPR